MNRRSGLQRNFNSFVDSSFTLFVDNLPHDVGPKWFRSFFSNFGSVKRYSIPNKVSKRSGCRFGFVTFGNRDEANMAIAKSNGIGIDNRNLFVKMARFTKNPNPHKTQIPNPQTLVSQPFFNLKPSSFNPQPPTPHLHSYHHHQCTSKPKSYAEIINNSSEKRITIQVHPIASSWLSNCSVVKLKSPSTPEMILRALQMAGISDINVKSMGGLFMLLIFYSKEERNNALSNPTLKEWFASFKPWNGEPASLSRFVWLKCRGVPIQAWNTSTFRRIGESWGDFINLDEETMKELSYDIGRMLITTDNELSIDEWINILINGRNYRVRVWEEPCDDPFAVIFKSQANIGVQTGASIDSVSHSQVKNKIISHGDDLEGIKDLNSDMLAELDAQSEMVKGGQFDRSLSILMQDDSLDSAMAKTILKEVSNVSHDLISFVEDSEGPILKPCQDQPIDVGKQDRMTEKVNQVNSYENIGRKALCLDGQIVIGSGNNIRASQLPSINLHVDLNPKEARKALRKSIRESSMSYEASEFVENTLNFVSQGQQHNPVLSELLATTAVGKKLGLELTDEDVLDIEKMIVLENRFAPLLRSTPHS